MIKNKTMDFILENKEQIRSVKYVRKVTEVFPKYFNY